MKMINRLSFSFLCSVASLNAQEIKSIEWLSNSEEPTLLQNLVGKEIQSKEFINTIKLLKSTDNFQDLEYLFDDGKLTVKVLEKVFIESIVWHYPESGIRSYVERDLMVQFDLREGDLLPADVQQRVLRLESRLHARGYKDLNLKSSVFKQTNGYGIVLDFVSSGKDREKYSKIIFQDIEDKETMEYLAQKMSGLQSLDEKKWTLSGSEFLADTCCFLKDEIELDDFRYTLRKVMRSRGFLNFDIDVHSADEGRLLVSPRNLKRFDFQFEGQSFFWESELRNFLLENLSDRNFEIEEAKTLIQDLYFKKGFQDVVVDPVISSKGSHFKIVFNIQENKQYFFRAINFQNVREEYLPLLRQAEREWLEPEKSPFRYSFFDEKGLRDGLGVLVERIRSKGFLDIEVSSYDFSVNSDSRFAQLKLNLRLGPRYQYSKFKIRDSEESLLPVKDLNLPSEGDYFDGDRLQEILKKLKRAYQDEGYLYSEIDFNPEKILNKNQLLNKVETQINIKRGPQVYLRNLVVRGNARTRKKVLLRELGEGAAEIGDKLSPKNLGEFENRLQSTGLFSTVDLKPVGENMEMVGDKALVDYQVDVKERAGGSLELGPGFRTDLGFVGFAEFAYRNIGGWNRGVFLKSTVSHKLQHFQFLEQDYSLSLVEPYPLGYRARLRFDMRYKLSDDIQYENGAAIAGFNKEETTFSSKLEKRFSEHFTTVFTLYTYELPRIFNKITEPTQSTQKYQLGGNGLEFLVDYRDNIFNPLSGWYLSQNVEYYSPLMGSLSGVNFLTSLTRFNKYFHLGHKAVLAFSLGYDHLWGIGDNAIIPENKRLLLGGRSSLRFLPENFLRYDEAGVSEQQAILGRVEYRVPLFLDIGMASFFEMGELDVLRDHSEKGKRSTGLRSGAGFGFRYGTPVGPISVDWAYNIGAREKEDPYQITLSIGTF